MAVEQKQCDKDDKWGVSILRCKSVSTSTSPIVPPVSPSVNDAPPILIDPVPAVTIDPPSKLYEYPNQSLLLFLQSSASYKHAAISIPPSDIHLIQACQVYLTQLDEQCATNYMVYYDVA